VWQFANCYTLVTYRIVSFCARQLWQRMPIIEQAQPYAVSDQYNGSEPVAAIAGGAQHCTALSECIASLYGGL